VLDEQAASSDAPAAEKSSPNAARREIRLSTDGAGARCLMPIGTSIVEERT
jgi:hypothetical protein